MAVKSYNTIRTFTGNGVQTVFNFALPFLRKTFIKASINGVDKVYGTDYTVDATEELTFTVAPPLGQLVIIKRITSTDPLVTWNDGSVLLAKDLSLQETQLLHIQEEMNDAVQTDAAANAELAKTYAEAAKVSEDNAKVSETNSKTSETNAGLSQADAIVSKNAANLSATNASASEGNALSSKNAAKVSEDNAKVSETNSKTSETNAEAAKVVAVAAKNVVVGNTVYVPTYPVGVPFPWVSTVARPDGTLLCDGSTFSLTDYPKLALVFPSGVLPDFRGVVPRGLDHARGLDLDGASRVIGSYQDSATKQHGHYTGGLTVNGSGSDAAVRSPTAGTNYITSLSGESVNETRMKNIAVDWLVYATTLQYDLTVGGGNATQLGGYPASHFATEAEMVGNRVFYSTPQALTLSTAYEITHNLNITDTKSATANIGLKCLVANNGFSVDDIVYNPLGPNSPSAMYLVPLGPLVLLNSVKFYVTQEIDITKPNGFISALTVSQWQVFVKVTY